MLFLTVTSRLIQKIPIRMASSGPPLHEMLGSVSWLLGRWESDGGHGKYPTIGEFRYGEVVEFTHVGQPNLQFSCYSWDVETKKPLHREVGFLRIQPDGKKVGLMIAQNLGVVELEEGEVTGQEMKTESHTVGRLTFGKGPATKKVQRLFRRDGDTLEQIVEMETDKTPMTEHLRIKYTKQNIETI